MASATGYVNNLDTMRRKENEETRQCIHIRFQYLSVEEVEEKCFIEKLHPAFKFFVDHWNSFIYL